MRFHQGDRLPCLDGGTARQLTEQPVVKRILEVAFSNQYIRQGLGHLLEPTHGLMIGQRLRKFPNEESSAAKFIKHKADFRQLVQVAGQNAGLLKGHLNPSRQQEHLSNDSGRPFLAQSLIQNPLVRDVLIYDI